MSKGGRRNATDTQTWWQLQVPKRATIIKWVVANAGQGPLTHQRGIKACTIHWGHHMWQRLELSVVREGRKTLQRSSISKSSLGTNVLVSTG